MGWRTGGVLTAYAGSTTCEEVTEDRAGADETGNVVAGSSLVLGSLEDVTSRDAAGGAGTEGATEGTE